MKKYKNKSWLRRQYVESRKTTYEIAETCGVTATTIQNWLDRHSIDKRNRSDCQIKNRKEAPTMTIDGDGYERFFVHNGGKRRVVYVHQLTAIANGADPSDIFDGYDVHHRNEVPWDNRAENLEVLTHGNHRKIHSNNQ